MPPQIKLLSRFDYRAQAITRTDLLFFEFVSYLFRGDSVSCRFHFGVFPVHLLTFAVSRPPFPVKANRRPAPSECPFLSQTRNSFAEAAKPELASREAVISKQTIFSTACPAAEHPLRLAARRNPYSLARGF